jgi:hypothetical protein
MFRLSVVQGLKQTPAAETLGIKSQGQYSSDFKDAWKTLNSKVLKAHFSVPLDEGLLEATLKGMPLTAEEQKILDEAKLRKIKDSTVQQPPPVLPTASQNQRLVIGLIAGIVLAIGLLAIIGALHNPFAPLISSTPGPTQTARIETHEVTVAVPQTVIVQVTVPVPQTVVVKEMQTQYFTVTQAVTAAGSQANNFAKITDTPTALSITQNASSAAPLFLDTFDTGPSPIWLKPSGDWNMRNGWLVNTGSRGLMWLGKQAWTDVVVEFDVTPDFCRGTVEILIRMQDTSNYVGYRAVGCNSERVYLVKDGKAVKDIFTLSGKNGHHQFEAKGNIYTVYQDGEFKGSGSDNTYTSGSVGVIIDGSNQQLDNFKVSLP